MNLMNAISLLYALHSDICSVAKVYKKRQALPNPSGPLVLVWLITEVFVMFSCE